MKLEHKILLSYAAGIIDGEGWVGFARKRDREFTPRIIVGMNHGKPLDLLFGLFGGAIRQRGWTKTPTVSFVWEISCNKAREVCKELLPFLRVKKSQAELLIRFQDRVNYRVKKNGYFRGCVKYETLSEHEKQVRQEMFEMMRKLNHPELVFPNAGATTKQVKPEKGITLVCDSLVPMEI